MLGPEERDELTNRVVAALGRESKCLQMEIAKSDAKSAVSIAKNLLEDAQRKDISAFVRTSKKLADNLAEYQTSRGWPGGVLVVISGTTGQTSNRVVCIIKAEDQTGFRQRKEADGTLGLRLLKDLFLTKAQRFFKIGAFIETDPDLSLVEGLPAGWQAFVFDESISPGQPHNAADYFQLFLGCQIPDTGAKQTEKFFRLTQQFIGNLDVDREKKVDLHNALTTYLKVDRSTTISVSTFSDSYLETPEHKDQFKAFMEEKEFPLTDVPKDTTLIKNALKRRKVNFKDGITLTGPPESFQKMVEIKGIDGVGNNGDSEPWTQITVHGKITSQE